MLCFDWYEKKMLFLSENCILVSYILKLHIQMKYNIINNVNCIEAASI